MASGNLKTLKKEFLEYVEIERGRSLLTVRNYSFYLERFLIFAKTDNPSHITDTVIREYRLWLNRQPIKKAGRSGGAIGTQTLKKRTQNYHLIALRTFLKYLIRRGIETLAPDKIELAKVGERSLDLISSEELKRLLDAPLKSGPKSAQVERSDLKALRDKALLETFFSTGLRVSELASLDRDIDLNKDEFAVRGKGDKVRVVFLSDSAKRSLKIWLSKRKDLEDALFIQLGKNTKNALKAQKALRLTPRSIERIVKEYAIKAGITRKVTPHVIRHSFATDLLQNGADLRSVQALLGHANIGTTQIYTHVTDRHLRDVHKKFHTKRD